MESPMESSEPVQEQSSHDEGDSVNEAPSSEPKGLGDLSPSCVEVILGQLSPGEICSFAGLNRAFYEASSSDVLWEKKLPSNYEFLRQKLFSEDAKNICKRDIFAKLCKSVRYDDDTKDIWVDKRSGKMCMAISWQGMRIKGIDDRRYWTHFPTPESRFHATAYLKQTWLLEVEGELEFNFPAGTYGLYFWLKLGAPKLSTQSDRRVSDGVHGWDKGPVRLQVSTSNGQDDPSLCGFPRYLRDRNWASYHAGNFTVPNHNIPMKVKFSLTQIDPTHPKGGLSLDSVAIYPHELVAHYTKSE